MSKSRLAVTYDGFLQAVFLISAHRQLTTHRYVIIYTVSTFSAPFYARIGRLYMYMAVDPYHKYSNEAERAN